MGPEIQAHPFPCPVWGLLPEGSWHHWPLSRPWPQDLLTLPGQAAGNLRGSGPPLPPFHFQRVLANPDCSAYLDQWPQHQLFRSVMTRTLPSPEPARPRGLFHHSLMESSQPAVISPTLAQTGLRLREVETLAQGRIASKGQQEWILRTEAGAGQVRRLKMNSSKGRKETKNLTWPHQGGIHP